MSVEKKLQALFQVNSAAPREAARSIQPKSVMPKKGPPRVSTHNGVPLAPEKLSNEALLRYCEKLRLKGEARKALLSVLRPKVDAAKAKYEARFKKPKKD